MSDKEPKPGTKGKNSVDTVTKELSDVTEALKKTDAEMESLKSENAALAESLKTEQDKYQKLEKEKADLDANYKKLDEDKAAGNQEQYKDLEENRDAIADDLVKEKEAHKVTQGLLDKERSKPAGMQELDAAKAELAASREKIANINQLEAELDLARKRVASYEDTNILPNTKKPLKLPPGYGIANVNLIPYAYYEVEFDGAEKPATALLLGENKPSTPNTIILFIEGQEPITLKDHVLKRYKMPYTIPENNEVVEIDRVVVEPQRK